MARDALHLLVTLLALSSLVALNAVPGSRSIHHLHESRQIQGLDHTYESRQIQGPDDINQLKSAEVARDEIASRRMDFQLNDYPGPGANNRHTPAGD